jgi:epoxyqueuosine reductase
MVEKLQQWAAQRGYRVAWGSRKVVESVRKEIADRRANLELNGRFFEGELTALIGEGRDDAGRTVVVVAKPRPAHTVGFDFEGEVFDALLPPTYFRYRAVFEDVRVDLEANGLPGARVGHLVAPLKAIAGRLGLVSYGRNNISYAPGLGSYFQLCGYLTDADLPVLEEAERVVKPLLPECEGCSACLSMCPTGAITEERMLLRAERCLTFANENPGDWPEWVDPRVHNCLLGCLECQRVCPANPELPIEHTGLRFSANETRLLLSDDAVVHGNVETGIRAKLAWLGQTYSVPVLGRNLRALRGAAEPARQKL